MGALLTLASLAQVSPGIASIYAVPGSSEIIMTWTETLGFDQGNTKFTVNFAYDIFNTVGDLRLSVNLPEFSAVSSIDFELITTAEYSTEKEGALYLKHWKEILYGFGHNRNNTSFILMAILTEALGGSNYYVFMTSFSFFMSHADPLPSPVPLPGAVWLLGTGLLGLACVGRRRKK
jgi:hypothetical protein